MKVKFYILFLVAFCQLGYAQISNKYTVYLLLNSEKQEMNVAEKKVSDSVKIKTFNFSKDTPLENFKYALSLDKNGNIEKSKKGTNIHKKINSIILYHYSYRNGTKSLKELTANNIITYEDFVNSEFKSFSKVLKNANKIYIIDSKYSKDHSGGYLAYEVVF